MDRTATKFLFCAKHSVETDFKVYTWALSVESFSNNFVQWNVIEKNVCDRHGVCTGYDLSSWCRSISHTIQRFFELRSFLAQFTSIWSFSQGCRECTYLSVVYHQWYCYELIMFLCEGLSGAWGRHRRRDHGSADFVQQSQSTHIHILTCTIPISTLGIWLCSSTFHPNLSTQGYASRQ